MNIEIKSTKLTKSKILQMDYIGIPINKNIEVLGWINIDKKRYVIIKSIKCYYRAEYIKSVLKEEKSTQYSLVEGGYEYPSLTVVKCETYNGGNISFSPKREDSLNLDWYDQLISFKRKSEIAGQIYY